MNPLDLGVETLNVAVVRVNETSRNAVLADEGFPPIQPADAEVFALAQAEGFQQPVLTDDLALRQRLEAHGAVAVGSVGVLVRAYRTGLLKRGRCLVHHQHPLPEPRLSRLRPSVVGRSALNLARRPLV